MLGIIVADVKFPDPIIPKIPLLLLYEVSIWSVKIIEKKRREKEHA